MPRLFTHMALALAFVTTPVTGTPPVAAQGLPWVAFSGEFTRVNLATGDVVSVGLVFVRSDGSERREERHPDAASANVIEIRDQSNARFCRFFTRPHSDGEWTCQPMDVMPTPVRGVAASGPGPMIAGLATVVRSNGRGSTFAFAPELSYFAVRQDVGGMRFELTRVRRAEPHATLFAPPDEVPVRERHTKGGQVASQR
jgi:hypothetical protein